MNTKPCMSSHNKRIIIFIYTKDCSDSMPIKTITKSKVSLKNLLEPYLMRLITVPY